MPDGVPARARVAHPPPAAREVGRWQAAAAAIQRSRSALHRRRRRRYLLRRRGRRCAHWPSSPASPSAPARPGGGALNWDHPQYLGGVGATGTTAANRLAAEADLVIGIGTRYSDFTTASRTAFQHPDVTLRQRQRHRRSTPTSTAPSCRSSPMPARPWRPCAPLLARYHVSAGYASASTARSANGTPWSTRRSRPPGPRCPARPRSSAPCRRASDPRDVVVQAAGSLPGDLHKLWRVRDALGYHVEYAFSAMGYEIAGGLGVKRGLTAPATTAT